MAIANVWATKDALTVTKMNNPNGRDVGSSTLRCGFGGDLWGIGSGVGCSGASETDVLNKSLSANALSVTGEGVWYEGHGVFAANGNNKRVRVYFGASTIIDTGVITLNNYYWHLRGHIVRNGAAVQIALGHVMAAPVAGGAATIYPGVVGPTETLSGAVTIRITVQGAVNNDVIAYVMRVGWHHEGN